MSNIYNAISALLLLVTPFVIAASAVVLVGLLLDVPGYVRTVRNSFRRARKTCEEVQHDWDTFYRD